MLFFFILYQCRLAFEEVKVTSYIDKHCVPSGDILVELASGNRFQRLKINYNSNENVTSIKEV